MSDATQLAARGVPITLADGTTVNLRYGMRSIALLEDNFGSLPRAQAALTQESRNLRLGAKSARLYGVVHRAIGPGLVHVRTTDPDTGNRVRLGERPDLVGDLLDPARVLEYVTAWTQALTEAFGALYERAVDTSKDPHVAQEETPGPTLTDPSPGPSGGTSASSSPANPPESSGA